MTLALPSRRAALMPGQWVGNALWRSAKAVPSLDLRFAESKSLVDSRTGQNLVTFTRASSATYVGSDGLIKTATTNLLLRSEEFDNAVWNPPATSIATVTPNAQIAPNGTLTADTFTTVSGTPALFQAVACLASTTYTWSFYVKLGTMAAADFRFAVRDDSNGVFIAQDTAPSITPVTTEWRRVTYTFTTPVGCVLVRPYPYRFVPATYGTTVFLWGAQLEQSSTVGEYIPTTSTINSAPRFDHNPRTGESLGLLVEEQRTNLLLQSEDFATTWTVTRSTITANATTAPNGAVTADKLIEDSTASSTHFVQQAPTFVSGTTYTYSVYAKAAERTQLRIQGANQTTWPADVRFDLSNGTIAATTAGTAAIQAAGNGWYRCFITATSGQSAATNLVHYLVSGTAISYTGDGTSGLFLWGAQLEAGAFPTSYIPTTTATVTRSADVASITGTNFSSWYRQDEGSFLVTGTVPGDAVGTFLSVDNNAADQRWQLRRSTSARARLRFVSTGNTIDLLSSNNVFSIGSPIKMSGSAIAGAQTVFVNGSNLINATATAMPTATQFSIGSGPSTDVSSQTISRLTYWPQRLSNSTLQTITQ